MNLFSPILKIMNVTKGNQQNFYEYVFSYSKNNDCNKDKGNQQIDVFDFNFEPVDTNESGYIDQPEGNIIEESHEGNIIEESHEGNDLRRSDRHRKSPSYLKDYHCQLSSHTDSEHLNHSGNVIHSLSTYLDYDNLTTKHFNYVFSYII